MKCKKIFEPNTTKISPRRTRAIIVAIFIEVSWLDREGKSNNEVWNDAKSVRILKSPRFVAQCAWLFAKGKKRWNTNRNRTDRSRRYSVALRLGRRICACGLALLPTQFRTCRF